jgi:hypothetical protein
MEVARIRGSLVYHARDREGGSTACGDDGSPNDITASEVQDELRDEGEWTEPRLGGTLCCRCLHRLGLPRRAGWAQKR